MFPLLIRLFMYLICKTSDLKPGVAEIYSVQCQEKYISAIIVIHQGKVFAYENRCPHNWRTLDSLASNINSGCRQYIQCSSHFAQFRKNDGYCEYGPCKGQSLIKLEICIKDDHVYYPGELV